jgi:tripartite-type tricarboxylate transporter receptor subunit TctC
MPGKFLSTAIRGCCHGATGAVLLIGMTAVTQAAETPYPNRPIRVIVATAPGGGLDAVTRIVAPKLTDSMGQTWVVDNRSGASGNLGAEMVVRANADGYTVLTSTSTLLTVNPSLYRMPFSIEKDLQPITVLAMGAQVVVVHPSVPAKTLAELITLAKQKPGVLNYASAGQGTAIHLGAELLKSRAGIDMTQVRYKGGGPAAVAVLGGEAQVLVGTVAATISFIQAGRLRALAATGATRSRLMPDLPTVAESGYPGFDAGLWFGMTVPGATPKAIAQRIHLETLKALRDNEVQTAMGRQGLEPNPGSPAELAARIRQETATWAALIKKLGIRAD